MRTHCFFSRVLVAAVCLPAAIAPAASQPLDLSEEFTLSDIPSAPPTPDPDPATWDPSLNVPARPPGAQSRPTSAFSGAALPETALAPAPGLRPSAMPATDLPPPPDGFTPPEALNSHAMIADDYPAASIFAQEQGQIALQFFVTETGDVSECRIRSSSGYPRLDDAACALVGRWKYKPAMVNGNVTSTFMTANVVFHLY
jgi:periplasmic protein TonB